MSCRQRGILLGGCALVVLALGAHAYAFTVVQIVQYPETVIAENVTSSDSTQIPYPITATFQQLDPAKGTLNMVTVEFWIDLNLVIHIPEFGGGSGGASMQGAFLLGGAMYGGAGNGSGFGGGGPAVFTIPFSVPPNPPDIRMLTAVAPNPDAFNSCAGTGTTTILWDATYSANWMGSPGGSVDLVMKDTSYIKVTYDYTPACASPPADADKDGDVDMDDFALWQRCFADPAATATSEICFCLDTDQNNIVDSDDLARFLKCFSGPGVQADSGCVGA